MNLRISTAKLTLGMQGDDVARLHQALLALGRDVPLAETARQVAGPGTVALVTALQASSGLAATGVVDAETVRAINAALAGSAAAERIVRGHVLAADGTAAAGLRVQLYLQLPAGEKVVGNAAVDAEGAYEIAYRPDAELRRIDLRVEVRNARAMVETTPPGMSILTGAEMIEVVDFVLTGHSAAPSSEFSRVLADIKPLIGSRRLGELADVAVLGLQSGRAGSEVSALAIADRVAGVANVPAEVLYALQRQGLPGDLPSLQATHPDVLKAAVAEAVSAGIVPPAIDGKNIESYLPQLAPVPDARLNRLLGNLLNAAELTSLASILEQHHDPRELWEAVAADATLAGRAQRLQFAAQVAGLTDSHDPLVAKVLARGGLATATDLVSLSRDDWNAMVSAGDVGVPEGTPGADAAQRTANYVDSIVERVEAAFPTRFLAARLGDAPVGRFLATNTAFDIRTTSLEKYLSEHPAAVLNADDRRQLQAYQRLHRITNRAEDTLELAANGFNSANKIAATAREVFAAKNANLPPQRAAEIHARALQASALALAVFTEHAAALNRTGLAALPRVDSEKQAQLAASSIPDWRTLFGASDACACEECASVHSAAAYFVDILHFLDDRDALAGLVERRPDLGDIELSCANTNTPLPVVDLVNEILEDTVAPPAAFTPFALPAALEADLARPLASEPLRIAFTPPLAAGSRIELLEAGKRWRIWDEGFTYGVVKEGGGFQVATRSRQTTGSAAARRATPEYRNAAAYVELAGAVYPWCLPFDLPAAEARAFLTHLGVPRRELIESLRPAPDAVALAAEGLGLTETERKIIVGEPMTPAHTLADYWGGTQPANPSKVQSVLDRAGLSYAELEALIATHFINPDGAVVITADPAAPDSCSTEKLDLFGLTTDVLGRLHRFVRLWRKLGWTAAELDKAIVTLSSDPTAPELTNEVLVRVDHARALAAQLRLPVSKVLALWRPIDTAAADSLYQALFYNPAIFKTQHEAFRLRDDGGELENSGAPLINHAGVLQAAFRLTAADVTLLASRTDGALNLANLSQLFRHAILAQQLRLTVASLLAAIELTGIDPFQVAHTFDTIRFVEVVTSIAKSGFDIDRLAFLLRHRISAAASFVPTEAALAQMLDEVRAAVLEAEAASPAELEQVRASAAIDRVADSLGVPGDLAAALLGRVHHGASTALQQMLSLAGIDASQPLSRVNAAAPFGTLEKLLKIADIVATLALPASQLHWLFRENPTLAEAPDPPAAPIPFGNWYALIQFAGLRRELNLTPAAVEALLGALTAIVSAPGVAAQAAAKTSFVATLGTWLAWPEADIATLIGAPGDPTDTGLLEAALPAAYGIDLLWRLNRTMTRLKRLGASAAAAKRWCENVVGAADARAIRDITKSKYDDTAWQTIVTPLQDSLRDQQRDALVAYLVARPVSWNGTLVAPTAADLYACFLVDVQMGACQQSSRLKQAIGSVQLYVQRCLMGLEAGVVPADPAWRRWNAWMKNYRVWEANRKIWLYPENWIEPELRTDKSPFFKDLESALLQSDLDNDAAEQAVLRYLEQLHEVSQLEIAGTCEDDDRNLHVFGRTLHAPRTYFYRRWERATETWVPWEKLELDIEGDHLIPVSWNRRLMLIWPVFSLKQDEKPATMPPPGATLDSAGKHWEIQLAWAEFQYRRWSAKYLSDPVRCDAYFGVPEVLFGNYQGPPTVMARPISTDPGTAPPPPDPPPPQPPGGGGPGVSPGPRVTLPSSFVTFKAFASPGDLRVRAYLRLDYTRTGAGPAYAYPFGEFRFEGCQKTFTAAPRGQMQYLDFALAAKGTVFDRMWFRGVAPGLTLLDGSFTTRWNPIDNTILSTTNVPEPLPEDVSAVVAKRIDLPVLGASPSAYRLLAPHQDSQFLANRPFFYLDRQRCFVVRSTGSSHLVTNPLTWVSADIATLGLAYARSTVDAPPRPAPASAPSMTVLAAGPSGKRIARQLNTFNLAVSPALKRIYPRFWSDREYTFTNFHHAYVCDFVRKADRGGLDELLSLETQSLANAEAFESYAPTARVTRAYPVDDVDFRSGGAFDLYNWELFFHIPLLIATRLSRHQRFEAAQRWFHYIFDPTGAAGGEPPQPYWRTKPFYDRLAADYEQESVQSLEQLATVGPPAELIAAVKAWRDHPFDPHAVARLRTSAFQKAVVMKYLDNLIAWGDQRFRGETIESINEATLLYVLAAEILGRRPERIERKVKPAVQTFNTLGAGGLLSNAMEEIELLVAAGADAAGDPGGVTEIPDPPRVLYFCVPENVKLLGYWDTVADRLFKIRHCMNIEGVVRQLPLFEPPIDPALLVRAAAAGVSIGEVLSDMASPPPNYRFSFLIQKATDLAADARSLGSALLTALEKRDAEGLATLRAGQELRMQQAIREVRAQQLNEATTASAALEKAREISQARLTYYRTRERISSTEADSLAGLTRSLRSMETSAAMRKLAFGLHVVGAIKLGSPTTAGIETGGSFVADAMISTASALDVLAGLLSVTSQISTRRAEFERRQDEWDHLSDVNELEIAQIDKQIAAADIRSAIARRELLNQDRQIDDARATDEYLREKFTNQGLYQWMVGQLSGIYFQSYQLAYDFARRAERSLQHELGLADGDTSYIRFGYWDSLKKGLLAGDLLAHDLRRLEVAYLDRNARAYELTRHVSLVSLAPEQLIALKETGSCEFSIPEWVFDLDTPGHYRRRLKMVNITIPCVTGPYVGIHCKATLLKSSYRRSADLAAGYDRVVNDPANPDPRFIDDRRVLDAVVTSSAQNDAGLFEPSLRDDRFLPFEGAGAISTWRLELPTEFRKFNYDTISDVILHLHYTALDDGALRGPATDAVKALLATAGARPLLRLFSLRHEFPEDWHRFVNSPAPAAITVDFARARFPYFAQRRDLEIVAATVVPIQSGATSASAAIAPGTTAPPPGNPEWTGVGVPGVWTIAVSGDPTSITELYVILAYTV